MQDIKKIQDLCERKGWDSRKFQYHILEELTGVDRETCKLICSLQRSIRFALPKDAVGEKLERSWRKTPEMHNYEKEAHERVLNLLN